MASWFISQFSGLNWTNGARAPQSGQSAEHNSTEKPNGDRLRWPHGVAPVCGAGLALGVGLGFYHVQKRQLAALHGGSPAYWLHGGALPFASIAAAVSTPEVEADPNVVQEAVTGMEFFQKIPKSSCCKGKKGVPMLDLAGTGVRSKVLFGIKSIRVYAFGVYVDPLSLKDKLGSKYKGLSKAALKDSKWLLADALNSDTDITVRLVIFYKGLKIGQVRKAFSDSVGSRLQTLSGKSEPELLNNFTKWFSDDIALQRGTIIDLKRSKGHVVAAEFDGKKVGSITSALLSRALLSLYIGDQPFDTSAKDAVQATIADALSE